MKKATALVLPNRFAYGAFALLLALSAVIALSSSAGAQLRIDITRPNPEPLPIAIVDFVGEQAEASRVGADIAQVINANLERSGLFRPIDRAAFVEKITNINVPPRFADWRVINAQALVTGAESRTSSLTRSTSA